MKKIIIVVVLIVLAFGSQAMFCKKHKNKNAMPSWITEKIAELEKQAPHKAKSYIKEYEYNDKKVYYIPADCCDQMNPLYDENGKVICHPSGGFTGRGDNKCPDFKPAATDGKLIWEDIRQKKEVQD